MGPSSRYQGDTWAPCLSSTVGGAQYTTRGYGFPVALTGVDAHLVMHTLPLYWLFIVIMHVLRVVYIQFMIML